VEKPVRIGIVGCGSVVRRPYMTLIEKMRCRGQVEVAVACDVRPERGRLMEDEWGVDDFTPDYRQVLDRQDVDLVLIATSMAEHGPIARAALEAGKHVLVEKPMAVSLEEAAELVALARTSPGYLVCAPHVVLSHTYQSIWRHLRRGDVGRIFLARGRYGWSGPWWGQWYYRPGGGPLFDLGVYNVTSLTGWLGPARRVSAMASTAVTERVVEDEAMRVEAEDNFQILLDFGEGCLAAVTTGFTIQKYRGAALELFGSEGTIHLMGNDWAPEGYEVWQNSVGAWQVYADRDPQWPWTDGLRHLVECIQTGRRPIITPQHAYHVTEIMIKALEAGRDGKTHTIESRFDPPSFELIEEQLAAHLVHDRRHQH
jgi:predicted dehydrogenase